MYCRAISSAVKQISPSCDHILSTCSQSLVTRIYPTRVKASLKHDYVIPYDQSNVWMMMSPPICYFCPITSLTTDLTIQYLVMYFYTSLLSILLGELYSTTAELRYMTYLHYYSSHKYWIKAIPYTLCLGLLRRCCHLLMLSLSPTEIMCYVSWYWLWLGTSRIISATNDLKRECVKSTDLSSFT